jgi:hypothetical protein
MNHAPCQIDRLAEEASTTVVSGRAAKRERCRCSPQLSE